MNNKSERIWDNINNEGGEGYNPYRDRDEIAILQRNDAARIAKYGRLYCNACGFIYRVTDGLVEDHAASCHPMSADKLLGL